MSGSETVSAAFGVIHLAKLTISGLYQLLRDYKDAGKRLFEIVEDFDCFQWRLDLWSRTWHIGQTSPESEEAHIKALWSDTGAKFIVVQLASIDEDCRRFTRLMAKLMGDEHLKEQNLQNQLLESRIIELPHNAKPLDFLKSLTRRSRARQYRDSLQLAHDSTSMKAKAHFVVSKGEALKELLKDLDNKFRKLKDDSLKAFCMRHPHMQRSASTGEISNAIHAETTLKRALDTRDASRTLYHWCQKIEPGATQEANSTAASTTPRNEYSTNSHQLKLDISLVVNKDVPLHGLNYHLFVTWRKSGQEQELLFEGPISPQNGPADLRSPWAQYYTTVSTFPSAAEAVDFEKACSTILQKNSERFIVTSKDSPDTCIWFQSRCPITNSISAGKATPTRLRELLESIKNKPFSEAYEDFPSAERIDLAYQVAECGLMLLGTSWLSGLRSAQLLRLKNFSRQQHLFILEVAEPNDNSTSAQTELLSTVEPQAFMIGVLLTEIAIAEPVVRLVPYSSQEGRQKLALQVTRTDAQGQQQDYAMKLGAVIRRVNNCMGLAYGDAVEFCLRQAEINRNPAWAQLRGGSGVEKQEMDEAYRAVLKDFHEQVFVRIHKLYELNKSGKTRNFGSRSI